MQQESRASATPVAADDRRRGVRHRALKKGEILFNGGYSGIDCLIRNLSNGGALLMTDSPQSVPDRFDLGLEAVRPVRHCETRWRGNDRLGVRFCD